MRLERVKREKTWLEIITIRLFRRWVAAREEGQCTTSSLTDLARRFAAPMMLAVALDSLFQLTEACIGRPLEAECCCTPNCNSDERAILLLISLAPEAGPTSSSSQVPHGLPGALVWAARSVCAIVSGESGPIARPEPPEICPFQLKAASR